MNPKRQSKTSPVPARTDLSGWQPGHPGGDENGFIIIAVIALVAILALVGTVAVLTTTTEIKISSNYKTGVQAFHAAQAGAEEARARLRGSSDDDDYAGDPASPDLTWSAYILTSDTWEFSTDPNDSNYFDPNYKNYIPTTSGDLTNTATETNTIQATPDISYWVKIRHKREYDAEQDGHTSTPHYYDNDGNLSTHTAAAPGNIIYYGYGNPSTPTTEVQFATSTTTVYKPVEIITSYGSSGSSSQIIKTEVVRYTGPPIVSALYSKGDTDLNGNAITIDGTDNCVENAAALPPVYLLTPADLDDPGGPTYDGNPSDPQSGDIDINIDEYVDMLKDTATEIITGDQNGTLYGNSSTFVTCYSNTSDPYNNQGLALSNVTGYGLLLIEGDLTLGGGFNWNGLILVTKTLTFNGGGGGGGINILGAVLANQTTDVNGNVDIQYDRCMIDNSFNSQSVNVIRWEDKKLK